MAADIPTLDLSRVQATIGTDEDGRPTLVIADGTTEVVLAAGGDRRETFRGSARVKTAILQYEERLLASRHTEPVNASRRYRS